MASPKDARLMIKVISLEDLKAEIERLKAELVEWKEEAQIAIKSRNEIISELYTRIAKLERGD